MGDGYRLFHVKDDDRSVFCVAKDWSGALEMWRDLIRSENDIDESEEEITPLGISFVAGSHEVLLPAMPCPACVAQGKP